MDYFFDRNLKLEPYTTGCFKFHPNKDYWNFNSAFGGWVAAATIRALHLSNEFRGEIISQHVQFISAVKADTLFAIATLRESKRTTDFWSVTISDAPENGRTLMVAEIIAGSRRKHDLVYDPPMPEFKQPEDCVRMRNNPLSPRWLDRYELMLSSGKPFTKNPTPHAVTLIREDDQRPPDAVSICAMLDASMPRVFFVTDKARMASTLSMSSHIYASDAEIAEVGEDYMILEADSAAVRHGLSNEEARLFRRDGLLIATSYQTALFK
ncbi:MAG: thioesterase family protein [Acidimicrobiales bacterium]|nr:thioesterase family protein [Hyphomonadaceae bacterium]RZV44602.1 MAG: thioesterase family protein [Acidimicrobiales bacterium]